MQTQTGNTDKARIIMTKEKVLFRTWRGKETGCVAIFPRIVGTNDPYTCQSYELIGEHGACDPHLMLQITRPATRSEYAQTAKALRRRGYRLDIRQRTGQSDLMEREKQLKGEA
jgi:hypothetical protein